MDLSFEPNRGWAFEATGEERAQKPDYIEALPRYLNLLDPVFEKAQEVAEFEFICALLGMRGLQDAGWAPYETTIQAVKAVTGLHNETDDSTAAWHLKLWIYGHILEASEPYELLANLVAIGGGGARYAYDFFDQRNKPRPISPATKIDIIAKLGREAGFPDASVAMREAWDSELRNAVFHSDYAFHDQELRLPGTGRRVAIADVEQLAARASAYHDAMKILRDQSIATYKEPKTIDAGEFSPDPDEKAVIIVRDGHGAIGLKHAWTEAEIERGAICWRLAVLRPGERELLDADQQLALLPAAVERGGVTH